MPVTLLAVLAIPFPVPKRRPLPAACPAVTAPATAGFFFEEEDGIRDLIVTGVQTCALPIYRDRRGGGRRRAHAPPPSLAAAGVHRRAAAGRDRRARGVAGARRGRGRVAACPPRPVRGPESGGGGKSVELGGRRISKKKKPSQ